MYTYNLKGTINDHITVSVSSWALEICHLPLILFQLFKLLYHKILQAEMFLEFQVALHIYHWNLVKMNSKSLRCEQLYQSPAKIADKVLQQQRNYKARININVNGDILFIWMWTMEQDIQCFIHYC